MNVPSNARFVFDEDSFCYAMKKNGLGTYGRFKKLAEASGVGYNSIVQLAAGNIANPSASTVLQLARALDCAAEDLMREIG